MKTFLIETYGCQMNNYDSDKISELLMNKGYQLVINKEHANIIIVNTCAIREKASEKLYSALGRIRKFKTEGICEKIIICGCLAQMHKDKMLQRVKYVDMIIGPQEYHKLPSLLESNNDKQISSLELKPDQKFEILNKEIKKYDTFDSITKKLQSKSSSFITIQEGCDNFCTFCIVPYTRGREYSRSTNEIMDEAKKLIDCGTKEIVLLGQNVNAYLAHHQKKIETFPYLLTKLCEIQGLERIRYISAYPTHMTDDLIAVHSYEKKLMPAIHLPIQSGSNSVLKKMNRKYTTEQYIEIIDKIRKNRSDAIFSSDFIVGFPGETEKDFEETLSVIEKVQFLSQSFSFKYSPREGTPAAMKKNTVNEDEKARRLDILQKLLDKQYTDYNKKSEGKKLKVLFDKRSSKNNAQISGRTEYMQMVFVEDKNDDLIGNIANVTIKKSFTNSLIGEIIN